VSLRALSVRSPVVALLCVNVFASTFSIGGFAPLLPEIARALRLSDAELGVLAGTFGFARMVADVPVGLFVRRHLRPALVIGPLAVIAGILCLVTGGSLASLMAGRALMGLGHSLGMVASLTAVLHVQAANRLGAALNAIEFSGMLGLLGGVTLVGWLPPAVAWNVVFLISCSPVLLALATLPRLLASLRQMPAASASRGTVAAPAPVANRLGVVALVFATGATMACAYSTIEQFLIPVRGSRHFGLDRGGLAHLLQISLVCDIVALLPFGLLADRRGASSVLAAVAGAMGAAMVLIAFGSLPMVAVGCALLGFSMAGWMLPLSVLRTVTAPHQIAVRTGLYRVGVDGGLFLGPSLSGLAAGWSPGLMPGLLAAALVAVGVLMAATRPRE
jgi:MFS family permease